VDPSLEGFEPMDDGNITGYAEITSIERDETPDRVESIFAGEQW
jgi:hypothetical protein